MSNRIMIRRAEKEDVRQIAEILVEDWKKAYRGIIEDDYLDSLDVDKRYEIEVKRYDKYIVACDDNEVVGCAWLEEMDDKDADCEIIALYVRYSQRNNGIGKILLDEAKTRFKQDGRKKMIIWQLFLKHLDLGLRGCGTRNNGAAKGSTLLRFKIPVTEKRDQHSRNRMEERALLLRNKIKQRGRMNVLRNIYH